VLREHREAEESPDPCDRARDRSRRQAVAHHAGDEFFERRSVERQHRHAAAGRKFAQPLQITPVTLERVLGQPAFHAQMRQVRVGEVVVGFS